MSYRAAFASSSQLQTTARASTRLSVVVRASSELKRPAVRPAADEPAKRLFLGQEAFVSDGHKALTIEYQRQRAKEMNKYFQETRLQEQVAKAKVFGWTPANEINNGRWVMFGLMVGILTEYATGVDFINQIGLMLSYLGIVDVE